MGNLALVGLDPVRLREAGIPFEQLPPWLAVVTALGMDIICVPLKCADSWRNALPSSWSSEAGGWFSLEYRVVDVAKNYPAFLTFEKFKAAADPSGLSFGEAPTGFFGGIQSNPAEWCRLLFQYMFWTKSTQLADLTLPLTLALVVALVFVIRNIKSVYLPRWQKIGRDWAVQTHGPQWLQEKENQERITKFGEYVYRLYYHSTISLVGFYYFWNAPWWDDDKGGTKTLWDSDHAAVLPSMCWYYIFQAAYNLDALVSLLESSFNVHFFPKHSRLPVTWTWADTVRGDFNEMLVHHLVTNALIFASSYHRHTRVGSMVFWMHDISDVPVDLTKLANFVKWKMSTVVCFFLTMLSWGVCRLYIFPKRIWGSIYAESVDVVLKEVNPVPFHCFYAFQPMFLILLGTLICLHAVWYSMFIRIIYVLVTKGETHDLTVHKNGEKLANGKHGSNDCYNGVGTNGVGNDSKKAL